MRVMLGIKTIEQMQKYANHNKCKMVQSEWYEFCWFSADGPTFSFFLITSYVNLYLEGK